MKYQELKEPCKSAIAEGRCLGCNRLADYNFKSDPNCKYIKIPSAEESIKQIKLNLGGTKDANK